MSSLHIFLAAIFLVHSLLHTDVQGLLEDQVCLSAAQALRWNNKAETTCPINKELDATATTTNSSSSSAKANVETYSCGGTPGWRRIGYLDMTDPSQSCPSGLAFKNYSEDMRMCGRAEEEPGCWSVNYSAGGSPYSKVCGRVRGYQFGATGGFYAYHHGTQLDSYYMEGVSLTHGPSGARTHIWSFTACVSEVYSDIFATLFCPCVTDKAPSPPAFVGNDYFCESGLNSKWSLDMYEFYPNDPLWDGKNCKSSCCQFNNPPFFTKTLPAPTNDDVELRICSHNIGVNEDTPIDQVELYVQ